MRKEETSDISTQWRTFHSRNHIPSQSSSTSFNTCCNFCTDLWQTFTSSFHTIIGIHLLTINTSSKVYSKFFWSKESSSSIFILTRTSRRKHHHSVKLITGTLSPILLNHKKLTGTTLRSPLECNQLSEWIPILRVATFYPSEWVQHLWLLPHLKYGNEKTSNTSIPTASIYLPVTFIGLPNNFEW